MKEGRGQSKVAAETNTRARARGRRSARLGRASVRARCSARDLRARRRLQRASPRKAGSKGKWNARVIERGIGMWSNGRNTGRVSSRKQPLRQFAVADCCQFRPSRPPRSRAVDRSRVPRESPTLSSPLPRHSRPPYSCARCSSCTSRPSASSSSRSPSSTTPRMPSTPPRAQTTCQSHLQSPQYRCRGRTRSHGATTRARDRLENELQPEPETAAAGLHTRITAAGLQRQSTAAISWGRDSAPGARQREAAVQPGFGSLASRDLTASAARSTCHPDRYSY